MSLPDEGALQVRVRGVAHDPSVEVPALVELDPETLRFSLDDTGDAVVVVPLSAISGAVVRDEVLTLTMREQPTIVMSSSPHLIGFRNRLEAAVCAFPAATLSLRHFGSESSAPGSEHDQWFEALLTSRRVAEETRTVETQRRVFDHTRLSRHATATITAWSDARGVTPADRRALLAEMEELTLPYMQSLAALEVVSVRLRRAPEPRQFDAWRRWTAAVRDVFRAADDVWAVVLPVLCDARGAQGTLWRRVLRRTGGTP